jgi:hypothetical protein
MRFSPRGNTQAKWTKYHPHTSLILDPLGKTEPEGKMVEKKINIA